MTKLNHRNRDKFHTLAAQTLPSAASLVAKLTGLGILMLALVLWFTPWVQTAPGTGEVSTLDPQDRIQAISALVTGQIGQWHVQEGQPVKKGDPIVTLVDTDRNLLQRLNAEKAAVVYEHQANVIATETARIDLERRKKLFDQGLVSRRDLEQANIKYEGMKAKMGETLAKVNQVDVRLSRLSSQTKVAPRDGTISRLTSAGSATYVKAGETLATFIPKDVERAVVMEISGLDAPLIKPGQKVRLQFEGWPVLQFSGWPAAAVGTFGGLVKFIEPVASLRGTFNVWLTEDPNDIPWPSDGFVRLGSKAKGWVLLSEVSLGYEIWRQLNNFPPEYSAIENGDYKDGK
ncbi:HlyD family secretion protein [Agarilytica rhodophyticola]|uniref:HlyD family secretion protein n=1 Tax=Agarilytica rhodophyticola TaxID=1737490 RepID=UPI000B345E78|nr:HlyD family efflux transporter periplasmic adaptor subunit [Agarilytica rhodophyticola]